MAQTRKVFPECLRQTVSSQYGARFPMQRFCTYQVVHEAIAAHNDNILLFNRDVISLGVLHGFVTRVGAELHGKVEGVLHLRRSEHHLSTANEKEAAVTHIGNQQCRVVKQSQQAC